MREAKFTTITGERVKALIREYNAAHPDSKINQKILAKKVLYTHETSLSEKLKGKRTFPPEEIEKIAEFFSVSPKWLKGETNYRSRLDEWKAIRKEQTDNFNGCCNAIEALCALVGVQTTIPRQLITTQDKQDTVNIEELLNRIKYGYVFKEGNRQVKMSLEDFLAFSNKLLEHFKIELRYLFDEKAKIIEGE